MNTAETLPETNAREDFDTVSALYDRLEALGLRPWMDKVQVPPARANAGRRSCRRRSAVCTFFGPSCRRSWLRSVGNCSGSLSKRWEQWQEKLDSDIYLIPVRLGYQTPIPETLRRAF